MQEGLPKVQVSLTRTGGSSGQTTRGTISAASRHSGSYELPSYGKSMEVSVFTEVQVRRRRHLGLAYCVFSELAIEIRRRCSSNRLRSWILPTTRSLLLLWVCLKEHFNLFFIVHSTAVAIWHYSISFINILGV